MDRLNGGRQANLNSNIYYGNHAMAEDDKPQVINAPNTLNAKVTRGGPGAVDPAVLAKAEQVITDMAGQYLDWVEEDLKKIQAAFENLKADGGKENLEKIFEIAHDMKGQGGSFGYPLITTVANDLCRMVENLENAGAKETEVIRLHIDTMRVIITNRMENDGGAAGEELLSGLEKVVAKMQG